MLWPRRTDCGSASANDPTVAKASAGANPRRQSQTQRHKPQASSELSDTDAARHCRITSPVDAEGAGAEGKDLQQPTCDRDILEEVDHRILVRKVIVEGECRRDRENCHDRCHDPGLVAEHEENAATNLDGDGN